MSGATKPTISPQARPVAGVGDGVGYSGSPTASRAASEVARPVDWTLVCRWLRARMAAPAARWLDRMVADKTASGGELKAFLQQALTRSDYVQFESVLDEWSAARGKARGGANDEEWRRWIL